MREYTAEDLRNELKPWIEELERKIDEILRRFNREDD